MIVALILFWTFLVCGGLIVLWGILVFGVQILMWLHDGYWTPAAFRDTWVSVGLPEPIIYRWIGAQKVLNAIPASIGLVVTGIIVWVGGFFIANWVKDFIEDAIEWGQQSAPGDRMGQGRPLVEPPTERQAEEHGGQRASLASHCPTILHPLLKKWL
jgi:hypothetical protein